jgi:hypothetical protein
MSEDNGIKCVNHEFCRNNKVPEMGSDYCMNCGSWFKGGLGWDKLTIVDSTDECTICMNLCERKLMFPTNCGHSFCINCSRNILWCDETRHHYGKATCPLCRKKYVR